MNVGASIAHTNEPELTFLKQFLMPELAKVQEEQSLWRTPSVMVELNTDNGVAFIYPKSTLHFESKLDILKLGSLCTEFAIRVIWQTTPARNHLYGLFQKEF